MEDANNNKTDPSGSPDVSVAGAVVAVEEEDLTNKPAAAHDNDNNNDNSNNKPAAAENAFQASTATINVHGSSMQAQAVMMVPRNNAGNSNGNNTCDKNNNGNDTNNNTSTTSDAATADFAKDKTSKLATTLTTTTVSPGKQGVCRIEVSRVDWLLLQPWQRTPQTKASGSGFVILDPHSGQQRLLTNAHVVRAAVDIRVRPHGVARRYPAQVAVYAPDVDLAILEIKGAQEREEFFASFGSGGGSTTTDSNGNRSKKRPRTTSVVALELAQELPALQESVHVVGFPTGGKTICVTEGVVSRIDLTCITNFNNMMGIQVDSAINSGNSGGPALNAQGQVVGVACKKKHGGKSATKVDNIGYLIPSVVVQAFLGRCRYDTQLQKYHYTLSPCVPYRWHALENHSLRRAHQVPDTVHGVLITSVCRSFSDPGILREGDVLTHVDGKPIADDGQVVLRGDELIQHSALLLIKKVDESVVFSVYRHGQFLTCAPGVLRDIPPIIPRWKNVDFFPEYLILGALALLPFSWPLRSEGSCGVLLQADGYKWYRKWPHEWQHEKQGLVVLVDIFSHELSFSYVRPWRRVARYNGVEIQSLAHLRDLWQASCDAVTAASSNGHGNVSFARLELEHDDDVVFEVRAAMEAQSEILKTHQIEKSYCIFDNRSGRT